MNFHLVNTNDKIFEELINQRQSGGKDVTFFDWVPTDQKTRAVDIQIKEMKQCQEKRTPVIVFDRYSSMTEEEVLFLHKRTKALLFEPSINPRPGFRFMPYWIHFREYNYKDFQDDRRFQTGYKGDTYTKDLGTSLLSAIKDKMSVGLDVKLPQDKYDILKSVMIIDSFDYKDLDTMILTGTEEDYRRGTLPDIRNIMYSGTVPCLYHKHKWIHSLFRHFVVYDHNDIRWLAKLYKTCGIGFIEDMQKNIQEYLPEMEAGNFVDSLLEKANRL